MQWVLEVFTYGADVRRSGSVCLRDVKSKAWDRGSTLTNALHEATSASDNVNNVQSVAIVVAADPLSDQVGRRSDRGAGVKEW